MYSLSCLDSDTELQLSLKFGISLFCQFNSNNGCCGIYLLLILVPNILLLR